VRAFRGKLGVPANDETFAREFRAGDTRRTLEVLARGGVTREDIDLAGSIPGSRAVGPDRETSIAG
jgi:hypothetical protein